MRLTFLLNPKLYILTPVIASCIAWSIPGEGYGLRGFSARAEVTFGGVMILVAWYSLCLLCVGAGYRLGRSVPAPSALRRLEETETFDRRFIFVLTLLATIGVGQAVFVAQQHVSIFGVIASGSGNQLNESIGGVAGLATLRYTTAVAAPVAIYLWRRKSASGWIALWNVALLAISSAFSNRLSIVLAVTVLAVLFVHLDENFTIRLRLIMVSGVLLFAVLTVLNYLRNVNFYKAQGVENPIMMNVYQVISYLGVPFQTSLGVANAVITGTFSERGDPAASTAVLIPSFFQPTSPVQTGINPGRTYSGAVDVAVNFNTNSAFADTFASYGRWGLLYILLVTFLAAAVFGQARQLNSVAAATCGVVAYCFAEYWRLFIFAQGIIIYLLLAIASATIFAGRRSSRVTVIPRA